MGPSPRTFSTPESASRMSFNHSSCFCATRRTHQASAWLRERATPPSTKRVEHPAFLQAEPGHRRHAHRGEQLADVAAGRAPRDAAPESVLSLLRDPHPVFAGVLAEAVDPRDASRRRGLGRRVRGSSGSESVPTTRISSRSATTSGVPANQSAGILPANQPPSSSIDAVPCGFMWMRLHHYR